MLVNLQTFSSISLANVTFRLLFASHSHAGKRDERSSDRTHVVCALLNLGINQTTEMADARYKEADAVLKQMSKKMEGLSSITTHMKLAMDYGLAISGVGHDTILIV